MYLYHIYQWKTSRDVFDSTLLTAVIGGIGVYLGGVFWRAHHWGVERGMEAYGASEEGDDSEAENESERTSLIQYQQDKESDYSSIKNNDCSPRFADFDMVDQLLTERRISNTDGGGHG